MKVTIKELDTQKWTEGERETVLSSPFSSAQYYTIRLSEQVRQTKLSGVSKHPSRKQAQEAQKAPQNHSRRQDQTNAWPSEAHVREKQETEPEQPISMSRLRTQVAPEKPQQEIRSYQPQVAHSKTNGRNGSNGSKWDRMQSIWSFTGNLLPTQSTEVG